MTIFNQWAHVTEEERQDQRSDVTSIDVGVAHDHNLVIAETIDVEFALAIFLFDADTESGKHVLYFLVVVDLMFQRFLYVEDLTTQRKDGLEIPVTTLLGCTTGAISLDKVDLAEFWIA